MQEHTGGDGVHKSQAQPKRVCQGWTLDHHTINSFVEVMIDEQDRSIVVSNVMLKGEFFDEVQGIRRKIHENHHHGVPDQINAVQKSFVTTGAAGRLRMSLVCYISVNLEVLQLKLEEETEEGKYHIQVACVDEKLVGLL